MYSTIRSIFCGHQGVNNHASGIINIKNSNVSSGRTAILNNGTGTINICSSILSTLSNINVDASDIHNWGVGVINYSNLSDNLKIKNSNGGTINSNYTGSCIE